VAKCVTECAESSIRTAAEAKQDFTMLGKIQGVDLRAKEARYHNSCRREYIRLDNNSMVSVEVDSSGTTVPSYKNDPIKMAYHDAFESVCDYVTRSVIQGRQIERMKMLHDRLQQYMETKHPQHYNPNHTTQKLKKKLIKRFAEQLSFRAPQDPTKSEIVFSSKLQIGEAVEAAFESMASEKYVLQTAAAILRRNIKVSCSNSKLVQWPPTAGTLQSSDLPPVSLTDFLTLLLSGKAAAYASDRTSRLSKSIAEDICSAATQGRWTMPKHLLLGMSIRHLTGNAEVITILNRYGHCCSYAKILELETAIDFRYVLRKVCYHVTYHATVARLSTCVGTTLTLTRKHLLVPVQHILPME
jgi:hypothetical protein